MGHGKSWSGLKPPGFKQAWNSAMMQDDGVDGCCRFCNRWAAELTKDGFCREEDCKKGRMLFKYALGLVEITNTKE